MASKPGDSLDIRKKIYVTNVFQICFLRCVWPMLSEGKKRKYVKKKNMTDTQCESNINTAAKEFFSSERIAS